MNSQEAKKSIEANKSFRKKYYLNEAEEEQPSSDAERKQKERERKYAKDWINFSVTVPPNCAEYLKEILEEYKKKYPSEFKLPEPQES